MRILQGLILVVVAVSLLGVLFTMASPDGDDSWQYDEYRVVDGAVSAEGSLEIVTVDGVMMVHANSIGPGRVHMSDGAVIDHDVVRAELDLIYLAGQSNAGYYEVDVSAASPVPAPGTGYYYGTESTYELYNDALMDAAEFRPMTSSEGVALIGDKAPSIVASYHEKTGHRVYLVCGAIGGKPIYTFDPVFGYMWGHMRTVLSEALDAVDDELYHINTDSACYMWIQGEADINTDPAVYREDFLRMHDALIRGDLGVDFKHGFLSKVRMQNSPSIAAVQVEICNETPTLTLSTEAADGFTVANGLIASDDKHYTQEGDNIIGTALGSSAGDWVESLPSNMFGLDGSRMQLIILSAVIAAVAVIAVMLRLVTGRD